VYDKKGNWIDTGRRRIRNGKAFYKYKWHTLFNNEIRGYHEN
jgi:hypothetical protein